MRASHRARMACSATLAFIAGCGDAATSTEPSSSTYLAFAPSFAGFRTWESFDDPSDPVATSPHLKGPRKEYLNKRPPHGSTEFPVGTILVKEIGDGDVASRAVFAMVKRGGGYNAQGAVSWEWFELVNDDDETVTVRWRGVGPPLGEMYGGDPNAGCNSCHVGARANDFVQSKAVQLGAM